MRIVFLLAFFITSTAFASSCPKGHHVPQLKEADAISIANDAAKKEGVNLSKFRTPDAHFEYVDKNCTWAVFYEGIEPLIGNHFLVVVDDGSRETEFVQGL